MGRRGQAAEVDAGHLGRRLDAQEAEDGRADIAEGAAAAEGWFARGVHQDERHGVRGMRGMRSTGLGIDHLLTVAMVGGDENAGTGALSVPDPSGTATDLVNDVTLTQLASVLKITLPELITQLQAVPGDSTISALLTELAANPNATLQNVLNDMTANGLDPASVGQALESLLAPSHQRLDLSSVEGDERSHQQYIDREGPRAEADGAEERRAGQRLRVRAQGPAEGLDNRRLAHGGLA